MANIDCFDFGAVAVWERNSRSVSLRSVHCPCWHRALSLSVDYVLRFFLFMILTNWISVDSLWAWNGAEGDDAMRTAAIYGLRDIAHRSRLQPKLTTAGVAMHSGPDTDYFATGYRLDGRPSQQPTDWAIWGRKEAQRRSIYFAPRKLAHGLMLHTRCWCWFRCRCGDDDASFLYDILFCAESIWFEECPWRWLWFYKFGPFEIVQRVSLRVSVLFCEWIAEWIHVFYHFISDCFPSMSSLCADIRAAYCISIIFIRCDRPHHPFRHFIFLSFFILSKALCNVRYW